MNDFEDALRNIDAFCRVLVEKMVEKERQGNSSIVVEPMEKLLLRKYVVEEHLASTRPAKYLIPLPQLEEPLIDIVEADDYVQVLMLCRCKDQKVTVRPDAEGLEICTDKCQKLDLPTEHLKVEDMTTKCKNNAVFEINIPKVKIK